MKFLKRIRKKAQHRNKKQVIKFKVFIYSELE